MDATAARPAPAPAPAETPRPTSDLPVFLDRFVEALRAALDPIDGGEDPSDTRDLAPSMMRGILAAKPLSVFIPTKFGGRGEKPEECLSVLEAASYESLTLALAMGINGALFLQPLSRYGREEIKADVFERFLRHQNMGGLMMTEPGYGSDALSMETSYVEDADGGYRIRGEKHWAGLTGRADYWLMTARRDAGNGRLSRDIDFFVLDAHRPEQAVEVVERYDNLGLRMIPYGRNRVDVHVPEEHRLVPKRTGLTMMLDLLHRSRLQFSGMGMGFLRRMLDEAVDHVRERRVGGRSLIGYDQVQARLARMQASVTAAAAMCAFASEHAGVDRDLSKAAVPANAIKAVMTDAMQEAAQSLLQLVGAKGYRTDHIAGQAIVDSRPFQIFEGSNDILYEQLAEAFLKAMRRAKETNLQSFLATHELASRASDRLRDLLDLRLDGALPQRAVIDLGRALGRVIAMEMVIDLGERGYREELVANALDGFRQDVGAFLGRVHAPVKANLIEDLAGLGSWRGLEPG